MTTIGLDFGTTNSVLSYFNNNTNQIETFKLGGVDGQNYIPSFVSIEDDDIDIGMSAKHNTVDSDDVISYSKFKILLGDNNKKLLEENGFKNNTPKEIAKIYLEKLLTQYKKELNINSIDKMVVSIPEIWIKDNLQARDELMSILNELNIAKEVKLESEPISAGAYFLHKYEQKHKETFNGHFLIFDFGGGTLDITLLESNNNKIKTLERTGSGKSSDMLTGKAGVAYDQLVLQTALKEQCDEVLSIDDRKFQALMMEFETKKITQKEKIEKSIEKYRKTKLDKTIFRVEKGKYELEIKPSLLINIFDTLFKDNIIDQLEGLKKHFEFYNIKQNDDKQFKIVLVGGFSNFYLSQKVVMDFFNSKTLSDKRFEQDFTTEDIALSISKGATLIAKDIVTVEQTYPMSIGMVLFFIDNKGKKQEQHEIVLKKSDSVKINNVSYSNAIIKKTGKPILIIDDGSIKNKIALNNNTDKLFPNHNNENNHWNVGFSVDKNSFYYIHFKDSNGVESKTEFSHLINEFRDTIFIKSDTVIAKAENDTTKTITEDDKLQNLIIKLQDKLKDAQNKEDVENHINTFSKLLENYIKEILKLVSIQCNIVLPQKETLGKKIYLLQDSIEKKYFKKLDEMRKFRNNITHQDHSELENISDIEKESWLSQMNLLVVDTKLLKEHFKL